MVIFHSYVKLPEGKDPNLPLAAGHHLPRKIGSHSSKKAVPHRSRRSVFPPEEDVLRGLYWQGHWNPMSLGIFFEKKTVVWSIHNGDLSNQNWDFTGNWMGYLWHLRMMPRNPHKQRFNSFDGRNSRVSLWMECCAICYRSSASEQWLQDTPGLMIVGGYTMNISWGLPSGKLT